jgi:two-component system NarL family sensor kinase
VPPSRSQLQLDIGRRPSPSVARAVAQFVLAGLVAMLIFLAGALFVLGQIGRREAIRDARQFAVLAGQGIVEPNVADGLLAGDRAAVGRLDRVVQERVLGDRVVRVKIWTRGGRIVYSDEPRLIGSVYPRGEDEQKALETGVAKAELSDLSRPENRFERGQGKLYEVYLAIRAPNGTPLLFETYQRESAVSSTGRETWLRFAAPLLASLVLLWLVQVPLAWRLADRLRRSQAERETLLLKALDASADERRRIAGDLHDGVVQDLAGLSYSLSAAADSSAAQASPGLRKALQEGASGTRDSMRSIRSLLVEIHPPNLHAAGLEAALADLLAPLSARGIESQLEVEGGLEPSREAELLLFRAAGEAIRNVQRHAEAHHVSVRVSGEDGRVRLSVIDDGTGFTPDERERRRAEGHVGLSLLEELAASAGGALEIVSARGQGTTITFEVPSP